MVGNVANFSKIDILRCFLRFAKDIGRQELAKELELGEGTVRTILRILKSKNLLDSTKKGHFLSKKGNEALSLLHKNICVIKDVALKTFYPDAKKVAVLVKNAPTLKGLHRLRDIAVKNGADGALILKFDGKLYAPESDYKGDFKEIEKFFDMKNDDALVVAFSYDKKSAENGALAIALELKNSLKKFIDEL